MIAPDFTADPFKTNQGNGTANDDANQRPIETINYEKLTPLLSGRPLIKNIIEREQTSLIVGESGCGKTFLALDFALCVATGSIWFGNRVTKGNVIYVAAEAGRTIANRVSAWRETTGIKTAPFAAICQQIDLCRPNGDLDRLILAVKQVPYDPLSLIVIDTVSRVLAGGNENSPEDMGGLVKSLDALRDKLNCHIMAVHHLGKDQSRGARGHNLLHCAVDTEIEVVREPVSKISVLTIKKQRDSEAGRQIPFRLKVVELGLNDDDDLVTSCVIVPTEAMPTQPKARPLPASQQVALNMLIEAIAREGRLQPQPPDPEPIVISAGKACVSIETWRKYCYEGGISDGEQEAKRKAFERAYKELVASKRVGWWQGFAWIA